MITCSTDAIANVLNVRRRPDGPATVMLGIDSRLTRSGRAMRLIQRDGTTMASVADLTLLRQLVRARGWWNKLRRGELDVKALARREQVQASYLTRILRLAFLSPTVVDAILAGRQRSTLSVATMTVPDAIAADWRRQAAMMLPTAEVVVAPN